MPEQLDENLVASNVESFVPYVPRSAYARLGDRKSITVTWPLSNTTEYVAEVKALADTTYRVGIHGITDGTLFYGSSFDQPIKAGEVHTFKINVVLNQYGYLAPVITGPISAPRVDLPEFLPLTVQVGWSGRWQFDVSEVEGHQTLENARLSATTLMDQIGRTIPSTAVTFTPSHFDVAPGTSQQVSIQIDRDYLALGDFLGSIILSSANSRTARIRVQLHVKPERAHVLYLPALQSSQ